MGDQPPPAVHGFDRDFFESEHSFTAIGRGAIGGKASGLVEIRDRVLDRLDAGAFPLITAAIPTLTVLTTEVFEAFMERNRFEPEMLAEMPDDRIAWTFQRGDLPAEFVGDLRALISRVHTPLAVRSSSLLEDDLDHPFAGVYGTKMIPNNQIEADARFRQLVEAIKFVYASTFFSEARSYFDSIGVNLREERMAVIIQEVVGERRGDRFYPSLSAVARSFNFYPSGHGRPEEGVVSLALGLGKTIVDGGLSWTYCPAWPKAPPPFKDPRDLLKNTQTKFWAVNMGPPPLPDPIRETEHMTEAGLADAEADGTLRHLVSCYDAGSDRLYSGLGRGGPVALTFAPILGSPIIRLNDIFRRLLELGEEAASGPVEIELAVTLDPVEALPARVGLLQLRPMAVSAEQVTVELSDLKAPDAVVACDSVLGNGRREDLVNLVYLRPESFDLARSPEIALELDRTNRALLETGRPYCLLGFGRWGSSDPWLGVPVAWGQISGARVIVEASLPGVSPDLSQGSHFFHNLLSFQVLYLSVGHHGPYTIDWQWLDRQPEVMSSRHVRWVRSPRPVEVVVDGTAGRGVIRHHELH